jgi:ferrous iron transport protein A
MSAVSGSVTPTICDPDQIGRILNPDQYGRSCRLLPFRQHRGARQVSVLTDLHIGETATLIALDLPESVQNYLMHMGFVPDAQVTALRKAPAGDPTVYAIDGMEIALRRETADLIRVRSNVGGSQGEIDAELKRIAANSGHEVQGEIREFAGATR